MSEAADGNSKPEGTVERNMGAPVRTLVLHTVSLDFPCLPDLQFLQALKDLDRIARHEEESIL